MSAPDIDPEPTSVLTTTTPEGITTITLNRPHLRNAVNPSTAQKLYDAVTTFENDPSQKVLILTGSNGNFCAGFDLHHVATKGPSNPGWPDGPEYQFPQPTGGVRAKGPMGPSRLQIKKPVISAVAGYAVAGGLELSLLGDMRVVEEDATFGVFCRRFGVPLIDGGTVRLQAIIGFGRAMDMILTGRAVGAQEALAMGLANRVVPKGKAVEEAEKIARQLVGFPQECMNRDRESAYHAAFEAGSFAEAMRFEFENGIRVIDEESVAGATRFSKGEGRHGVFKGADGKL